MIDTTGKTISQVVHEVMEKLVQQGKRCMSGETGQCMYGDGEGNHCAIGWLLPEDDSTLMSFTGGIDNLVEISNSDADYTLGINSAFIVEHRGILFILQNLHDNVPRTFRTRHTKDLLALGVKNTPLFQQWIDLGVPPDE